MSDSQLAAISMKLDELTESHRQHIERIDSLELVMSAVLQALRGQQMPMLGTIIEKLDKILEAAGDEKAGGELAKALKGLAGNIEQLVEQDGKLLAAVEALPLLIEESVINATGGTVEAPPMEAAEPG